MIDNQIAYNEQIGVFSATDAYFGTAHLVGSAKQNNHGRWSWKGHLGDPSFDLRILAGRGEIRIEFSDGAVGRAFCELKHRIRPGSSRTYATLIGNGKPPRVEEH